MLLITERDVKLLYDCYHSHLLTVSQIRERHFRDRTKSAAFNRLSRLKDSGLLRPFQVGTILYQNASKRIGVIYQTTNKGITLLKTKYPEEVFRAEPIRLSTSNLSHDLLLTQVLDAVKERFPKIKIITGGIHGVIHGAKRLPDAVILDNFGRVEVAIELELTAKSKKRYREIILQYKLAPQFPKVLYIAGSKSLEARLKFAVTERREVPGLPPQTTGKFFFCSVQGLLQNPKIAAITNGATELQIS